MRSRLLVALGSAALVAIQGCSSPPTVADAPMELDGEIDTTWAYLAAKYDTDGDGRIVIAEYTRTDASFDRLDRNDDDAITSDDFERGGGMARQMQGMRAQRIVSWYFQDADGSVQEVTLVELEGAFAAYDADGDGRLVQEEFTALADERRVTLKDDQNVARYMRNVDPWEALVASIDADEDSGVTSDEMIAFFKRRDDGDLVWTLRTGTARGGPSADPSSWSGPHEGDPAPDFALPPPDGGEPVRLSSFRRNLPVALIFGSYT